MKKLMIAAAIVCAAAFANAATASWTMTNVAGPDGKANDGVAYMFAYQTGSGYSAATVGAAILKAYTDGYASKTGMDAVEAFVAANSANNYSWTPSTAGTYSDSSKTVDPVADFGLTARQSYNMYAVIFDADAIADSTAFVVSKELTNKACPDGSSNMSLLFGTQADYTTTTKWQSIPEPTSGLLLLLGVAGLALRRRRA